MLSLVIFSILTMIIVGVAVLSAQDTKSQKANKRSGVLLTPAEIQAKYMDLVNLRAKEEGYPEVKSKEEALSFIKANQISSWYILLC